jgi:hypothetical protein
MIMIIRPELISVVRAGLDPDNMSSCLPKRFREFVDGTERRPGRRTGTFKVWLRKVVLQIYYDKRCRCWVQMPIGMQSTLPRHDSINDLLRKIHNFNSLVITRSIKCNCCGTEHRRDIQSSVRVLTVMHFHMGVKTGARVRVKADIEAEIGRCQRPSSRCEVARLTLTLASATINFDF